MWKINLRYLSPAKFSLMWSLDPLTVAEPSLQPSLPRAQRADETRRLAAHISVCSTLSIANGRVWSCFAWDRVGSWKSHVSVDPPQCLPQFIHGVQGLRNPTPCEVNPLNCDFMWKSGSASRTQHNPVDYPHPNASVCPILATSSPEYKVASPWRRTTGDWPSRMVQSQDNSDCNSCPRISPSRRPERGLQASVPVDETNH